jgi:hypothetical protein
VQLPGGGGGFNWYDGGLVVPYLYDGELNIGGQYAKCSASNNLSNGGAWFTSTYGISWGLDEILDAGSNSYGARGPWSHTGWMTDLGTVEQWLCFQYSSNNRVLRKWEGEAYYTNILDGGTAGLVGFLQNGLFYAVWQHTPLDLKLYEGDAWVSYIGNLAGVTGYGKIRKLLVNDWSYQDLQ